MINPVITPGVEPELGKMMGDEQDQKFVSIIEFQIDNIA